MNPEPLPLVQPAPAVPTDRLVRSAVHPEAAGSPYRWLVCGLLFCALAILYADRQILGLLKPMLDEQFRRMSPAFGVSWLGWSNTTFGLINSVFVLAYGFGMLGFGWFIDRYGTKVGYALCMAAWSVSAGATALVGSIGGFFVARVAVGASESGCFPCSVKSVALWFPKRERALATSLFNSGTNVGALAAPALVPMVASRWGWKCCYVAAALAGVLWLGFWWRLYRTPRRAPLPGEQEGAGAARRLPWSELIRYRQTWSFVLAKLLTDPVWWFFLIWLPDYFKNSSFHLDLKKSWPHLMTIYLIVTALSIFGGWITGYLTRRGWSVTRARRTGMFFFALLVLPILAAKYGTPWVAVGLIGLAGAAHQAWSANLYTTVSDMFPQPAIASVTGIGGLAGCLSSAVFPYVTGAVLDHFKAKGDVSGGYALLFTYCGCAYLLAFAANALLAPKLEPMALLPTDRGTRTPA